MRSVDFRYKIIRNGAEYGEIHAIGTPLLRMIDSSNIKTSLTGIFAYNESLDCLTDRIRPEIIIDGVSSPLGLYLPATVQESEDETTRSMRIEAYDQCWLLRDHKTEELVFYRAGTNYINLILSLLATSGIGLVVANHSSAVLAEDRQDWDIGTSYLTIVNTLLSEINYNPLWFDASGYAVLEPASVPTADNIEHTLDATNVKSLMLPTFTRNTDIYQKPNVFVCICSNADKDAPMVARAENTNPQSPLSIARRGRRITSITRVDNIASQAELQSYANRLRDESMMTGEKIIVKTALLPGYGVADVTALLYGELSAICVEHAWTMELTVGGTMTHTLERVVVNLG